jgi:catechol 2,3-dioxygenase-like lactoylglutathione lyase family enzyme
MLPLTVLETALYVDDLEEAERFYRTVLDLELDSKEDGRHVFFKCGDRMLLIFDPRTTAAGTGEIPGHGARGPGHVAFAVEDDDLDAWRQQLESRGIAIEACVEWPAGGRSIYFRDPAGNSLELTTPLIWGIGF